MALFINNELLSLAECEIPDKCNSNLRDEGLLEEETLFIIEFTTRTSKHTGVNQANCRC